MPEPTIESRKRRDRYRPDPAISANRLERALKHLAAAKIEAEEEIQEAVLTLRLFGEAEKQTERLWKAHNKAARAIRGALQLLPGDPGEARALLAEALEADEA